VQATLYSDGGSRGNPGIAGAGFVLFDERQTELARGCKPLGIATNNFAEYQALILGLKAAAGAGVTELICLLDSELIVKQQLGIYRVKHPDLKPLHAEVGMLGKRFAKIGFRHIPREQNKLADRLANEAMDIQAR
jgi:ribonuclease HI